YSFARGPGTILYAGGDAAAHVLTGGTWYTLGTGLAFAAPAYSLLYNNSNGSLSAGTLPGVLVLNVLGGSAWQFQNEGIAGMRTYDMAAASNGDVYAAT